LLAFVQLEKEESIGSSPTKSPFDLTRLAREEIEHEHDSGGGMKGAAVAFGG
jgi:hypothetical protein